MPDPTLLTDAIDRVGSRHELVKGWLNDNAAPFWPASRTYAECEVVYEHDALVVSTPGPDILFVVKLYRADAQDREDLILLWPLCDFADPAEAAAQQRRHTWAVRLGLVVAMVLLVGCGGGNDTEPSARPTTSLSQDASMEGEGKHVSVAALQEPPKSPSGGVTAEQAEGVSGAVIDAWLQGDRARAERFATAPDAVADLFAVRPPSKELTDEGEAYCSQDEASKSFTGCSYSVKDDSPDGIFAVATEVTVANGLVLVRSAGAAGWND